MMELWRSGGEELGAAVERNKTLLLSVLIIHPFNRPGVIRFRTLGLPLQDPDQGIYTCTIPDSNGRNISLNVGLYPPGFNGELTLTVSVNGSLSQRSDTLNLISDI